jgi:hypothetical protein
MKKQSLILSVCLLGGLMIMPSLQAASSFTYDGFNVVQENAGMTTTTVAGATTETFNEFSTPTSAGTPVSGLSVLGGAATLTGGSLFPADEYGGAGGGNFYNVGSQISAGPTTSPGTLTFNTPQTFFGMLWSAADGLNEVQFYNGSTLLGTFVSSEPGTSPLKGGDITQGLSSAYEGNPSGPFAGQDGGEYFAYVDFTDDNALPITSVVFSDGNESTGFEMDNFSIVASTPDAAGTMTLLGLGLGGLAVLGRRFRK